MSNTDDAIPIETRWEEDPVMPIITKADGTVINTSVPDDKENDDGS